MADTTPTPTTDANLASSANVELEPQDAVLRGEEGLTEAIGQAGAGAQRPLTDETQLIQDVAPGDNFILPAGVTQADLQAAGALTQQGGNLIVTLPSGSVITLQDYFLFIADLPPALTLADGSVIDPEQVIAILGDEFDPNAIAAAAGGGGGGGGGNASFTPYASGDIGPGGQDIGLLGNLPGFGAELPEGEEEQPDLVESEFIEGDADTDVPPLDGSDPNNPPPNAVVGAFGGAFEDAQPNKHIGAFGQVPAHITFDFIPADNEFIEQVTLTGFPAGATVIVGGVATLIGGPGQAIVVPNAHLDSVFLIPPSKDDADIVLNFSAVIKDPDNGTGVLTGSFEVIVDAVADIPVVALSLPGSESPLTTEPGAEFSIASIIDVVPTDSDGSEQQFALIKVSDSANSDITSAVALSHGKLITAADPTFTVGDVTFDLSADVALLGPFWAVLDSDLGSLAITFPASTLEGESTVFVFGGSVEQELDLGTDELTLINNVATTKKPESFTILIEGNPNPTVVSADPATVDEDGFAFANLDGTRPGQETDSTESTTANGTIVIDYGTDIPAVLDGSLVLLDTSALDGQLKTLDGQPVTFALVGGKLVGSVDGGETPVITIEILSGATQSGNTVSYSYLVTLHQPIQHSDPNGEDSELLSGVTFQATDLSGDSVQGSFNVTVFDDIPVATDGEGAFGIVDEDDLDTVLSQGTGQDAQQDGPAVSTSGSLAGLVSVGADAPIDFSLKLDTTSLESQSLSSKGDDLSYSSDGTTLTAFVDTGSEGLDGGDRVVFTLTLQDNGSWTFTLFDQLDHADGLGENFLFINFAGMVEAADADGDTIDFANSFTIAVQDDVPVAHASNVATLQVHEDALGNETEDAAADDDDLSTGNLEDSDPETEGVQTDQTDSDSFTQGDLQAVVTPGADEPVTFSLNNALVAGTAVETTGGTPVTSKGDPVKYLFVAAVADNPETEEVDESSPAQIIGFADEDDSGTFNEGDRVVFTLTANEDGSFTFNLDDQLDHPDASGDAANLALDLTTAFQAEDFDGDAVTLAADSIVVNVENDVPAALSPETVYLVNAEVNPAEEFDLNFLAGADGIDTVVFNIIGDGSEPALDADGNQLFLNNEPLLLFFGDGGDETQLVAKTADGDIGFVIDIDPTTGTGTFTFMSSGIISNATEVTPASLAGVPGGFKEFVGLINQDIGGSSLDILMSTASGSSLNTNANEIGIDQGNSFEAGEGIRFDFVEGLAVDTVAPIEPSGFTYDEHSLTNAFRQTVRITGSAAQRANFMVFAIVADDDQEFFGTPGEAGETVLNLGVSDIRVFDENGDPVWDGANSSFPGDLVVTDAGDGVLIEGMRDGWTYQIITEGEENLFSAIQLEAETDTDTFKLGSFTIGEALPGEPIELSYGITGTDGDGDAIDGIINATLFPAEKTIVGDDNPNTLTADDLAEGDPDGGVVLLGFGGDDSLTGGDGDDILVGGAGDDDMTGGGGDDVFLYGSAALGGHDTITDFLAGGDNDVIDLDALFDSLGVATADRDFEQADAGGDDTLITLTDAGNPVADFSITLNDVNFTDDLSANIDVGDDGSV